MASAFGGMMLRKSLAVVYTAFALGAIIAAGTAFADIADLRVGEMRKLAIHDAPVAVPEIGLVTQDDASAALKDHAGKWVLVNFWATWCAPCRHEMPSLDRLQVAMPELVVVPVATGRNAVEGIKRFYGEAGVTHLPILRDPKSELARAMGVLGLPITVILNPQGEEVARLIGDAEWDSADAQAILRAFIAGQ
jgi:thiol-disulfide isomerase/thioredoxin